MTCSLVICRCGRCGVPVRAWSHHRQTGGRGGPGGKGLQICAIAGDLSTSALPWDASCTESSISRFPDFRFTEDLWVAISLAPSLRLLRMLTNSSATWMTFDMLHTRTPVPASCRVMYDTRCTQVRSCQVLVHVHGFSALVRCGPWNVTMTTQTSQTGGTTAHDRSSQWSRERSTLIAAKHNRENCGGLECMHAGPWQTSGHPCIVVCTAHCPWTLRVVLRLRCSTRLCTVVG